MTNRNLRAGGERESVRCEEECITASFIYFLLLCPLICPLICLRNDGWSGDGTSPMKCEWTATNYRSLQIEKKVYYPDRIWTSTSFLVKGGVGGGRKRERLSLLSLETVGDIFVQSGFIWSVVPKDY